VNKTKTDLRLQNHRAYLASIPRAEKQDRPNIVLVMVDDLGHGDISCYGSKAIHTPNLDDMASHGVKMTDFYASSPVCSASRFGCLTGRYPTRGFVHGVFFPSSTLIGKALNLRMAPYGVKGILPDEVTFAEALQRSGYKTGIFGKWHLGDTSPYLPNEKGFDHFFGSYYSNDMKPYAYYRNDQVAIRAPADQTQLTRQITAEILTFIDAHKDRPFLVYYPSPFPHNPAHASADFTGSSQGGTYGDCVQEIDWSVGEIRKKLAEHGLTENTLIIFTSDNGPWFEGSPGLHRGRKGNNFDGGQIVPMIASWPKTIPQGIEVNTAAMNIDFFPTFLNVAGVPLPTDREIDGADILPVLKGEVNESPHAELYFISGKKLMGFRAKDNFKYVDKHKCENSFYGMITQGPFLFDLSHDQNESYNVSMHFPEKDASMRQKLAAKRQAMKTNPRGWKK
jgi:arylsulfatase A-like enzyme